MYCDVMNNLNTLVFRHSTSSLLLYYKRRNACKVFNIYTSNIIHNLHNSNLIIFPELQAG